MFRLYGVTWYKKAGTFPNIQMSILTPLTRPNRVKRITWWLVETAMAANQPPFELSMLSPELLPRQAPLT